MLTISGGRSFRTCDGVSRRNFLTVGSLGAGALTMADLLRADAAGRADSDQSVVMIYLPGGPTQHETFDPKPDAPREIRGSFDAAATCVPGVRFCELLPKLSRSFHRFSVVRSLVGMANRHESFQCYTGRPGGRTEDNEPPGGWPSFGSVVSKVLGPPANGGVPYVDAAPKMGYRPYGNNGVHLQGKPSWPGFTGPAHVPLALEGDVKSDMILTGIDEHRLRDRRDLLASLSRLHPSDESAGIDDYQQQAFGLLTSGKVAAAIDLEQESPSVRARYGKDQATHASFGGAPQSAERLLIARRLVEAGVRCVSVAFGAWDWHANREGTIEFLSKKYLPVFDHALATFLSDLEERDLLQRTTVIVWGEFGRTPKINAKGGRDHWPSTQSVLLAGGGIHGGRIIGETDYQGGVPASRPVHVQEIFATMYRNLGIDINNTTINDLNGRPRYLVDSGYEPIRELLV